MRINRLFTVLAVAFVASACNRPQLDESVALGTNQFNATMGDAPTKVSMNSDYSLYWEVDDQVSVFAPDNVNRIFTATSSGASTILDGPEDYDIDASATHYAIYPYSKDNSISDGVITAVIPYEQTPRTGSFPVNFSVARSTGGKSLSFYNVCGLMGFRITRSDIVKVSLKSHGSDEYMAGKISIDCATVPQPGYSVLEGKTEVTLVSKNGFASGDYYVAILPRKYTGMTITMYTSDGQVGYVESMSEFTLHRSNHIKPLAVDMKPFGGSLLARWVYASNNSDSPFKTAWVTDNSVPADQGQGSFSYVTVEQVNDNFKRTVGSTGAPIVYGAWPGDYWLYEVPVSIPANTRYSINFAARVSDTGHKFWMLEYLDGSEWKPIGAVNSSDEPGSTVSYTHTMENADATVGGTFTVTKAMSALKIRYRCVANWKIKGGALSARNGGTVRMSQANNATLDIWALDKLQDDIQTTKQHTSTQWITSNSTWGTDWTTNNRFYALSGDYKSKAYISTAASGPERYVYDSKHAAVRNLKVGDCICFTVPSQTLSASARVSFMANMMALSGSAVSNWVLEYKKDGSWTAAGEENDFYIKYFSAYQYTTFTQSFTLGSAINDGNLEMRIRVTELSGGTSADVAFCKSTWQGVNIDIFDDLTVKDKKRVLILGNSFSYYHATNFMLHQLALSQGHDMKMYSHTKGSQTFANHMSLERSLDAIRKGHFDYVFLQDQSQQHSNYYMDPAANKSVLDDTKSIIAEIRQKSPSVNPILENTWSYSASSYNNFGSHDNFDKALYGGGLLISDEAGCWLSPIGVAFQKARAAGISDLYHSDDKHPGVNGSYLKACVNYLMIYGEAFTADAADNIVDAATAVRLRTIAEEVVLGNISKYRNPDSSGVVPGDIDSSGDVEGEIVAGENGIRTPDQLFSFAKVVNAGGDISSYCNSKGEVVLLGDIELPKTAWTPIGAVSGIEEDVAPVPTVAFTGVFDGNGYVVTGLQLAVSDNATTTCGFFGALSGATVRNVTFEDVVVKFNSTGISASHLSIGTIAGYALNSTISNVTVYAQYSGTATSTKSRNVCVGGIAGSIAATEEGRSLVSGCVFDGTMTNDIGTKYTNTNSVSVAGIVGGVVNNGLSNKIVNCTNGASINVKCHRAAGIVASSSHAQIEDCTNNGDITVVHSASKTADSVEGVRAGGIAAYSRITKANDSYLKNCTNNGTITTTQAGSAVGGVAGLVRLTHLEGCRNTGSVFCSDGFAGLLVGRITSADGPVTFTDCHVGGKVGAASSDATAADADNYMTLGVNFDGGSDTNWTTANIHFLR